MQSPIRRRKLERLAREAAGLPKELAAQIGIDDKERPWRELGETLDALVRSLANRDRLGEGLARRVHALWTAMPSRTLDVKPAELTLGKHSVLAADAQRGRWILPAYMAGLRRLSPHDGSGPDDVSRLAFELAKLCPDEDAIDRFAEWLACDCSEGFVIATYPPFAALGRALSARSLLAEGHLEELSRRAVDGWNGRAWELSRRLEPPEAELRFARPAAAYLHAARAGELELAPEEVEELRNACNELAHWSRVETQTVLEDVTLGTAFTPRRLSARLDTLIATSPAVGNAMLSFLAGMSEADAHGAAVVRALDSGNVGEQLAGKLEADLVDASLVVDVLGALGSASAAGLMRRLLERAGDEELVRNLLVEMMRTRGAMALQPYIENLRQTLLVGRFYAAALEAGEPVARVRARVDSMPPAAKAAVLAASPRLAMQIPEVTARVLIDSPRDAAPLVDMLAEQGRSGAEILSETLEARGRDSWKPMVRKRAMQVLVAQGLGFSKLLPLARSRDMPLSVRLAAIDAMCGDPRLRRELARWRPHPMREPKELREKLAQIQWDEDEHE